MNFTKFARVAVVGSLLGLSPIIGGNAVASGFGTDPATAPDAVYSYAIVGGIDVVDKATEGYLGSIFAFNGDLDKDGFLFRSIGTYGFYEDVGNVVAGVDDRYWQTDVMLGYQVVRNGVTLAAYAGVDFQRHKLSPDDPTVVLRGTETGFKVALDIETERHNNSRIYFAAQGAYSTAFENYYALGRIGLNMGRIAIGPEAMLLGDESGDARRIGGFALTNISLGGATTGTLSASVGYQFVDDPDRFGSSFGEEGVYGTLQFTMAFGTLRQTESYK
jgi:Cellulose biosynthesis protein BcsS